MRQLGINYQVNMSYRVSLKLYDESRFSRDPA